MPGRRRSELEVLSDESEHFLENSISPPKKKRKTLADVQADVDQLSSEGFKLSLTKTQSRKDSLINNSFPKTSAVLSMVGVFVQMFAHVFEILRDAVNFALSKKIGKISKANKKYYGQTDTKEIAQYYLSYNLSELLVSKGGSLKETYDMYRDLNCYPLSRGRYYALSGCFVLDDTNINKLNMQLNENYRGSWSTPNLLVVDESVFSYNPKAKTRKRAELARDPIPKVYIPRKPHPNGLMR